MIKPATRIPPPISKVFVVLLMPVGAGPAGTMGAGAVGCAAPPFVAAL